MHLYFSLYLSFFVAYFSIVLVYRDDELALALQTGLSHLEQPIFELAIVIKVRFSFSFQSFSRIEKHLLNKVNFILSFSSKSIP